MSTLLYNVIAAILALAILYGLNLMSNVKTAVRGNILSAAAMACAILITMYKDNSLGSPTLWIAIALGTAFGLFLSNKVKMIQMPQLVAFLHGFGGGAAALVGIIMLTDVGTPSAFHRIDACLALCSGMTTIAGSFVRTSCCRNGPSCSPTTAASSTFCWASCSLPCAFTTSHRLSCPDFSSS